VLGAWKFQQGKFCNFGKSGLRFLGDFVSISTKEGFYFLATKGHTCEERGVVGSHVWKRQSYSSHVWKRQSYSLHV
jgi:hypothetical protein